MEGKRKVRCGLNMNRMHVTRICKGKSSRELYPKAHGQIGMGTWVQREMPIRSLGTFEVAVECLAEAYVVPEATHLAHNFTRYHHCKSST